MENDGIRKVDITNFCRNCGTAADGARFCGKCGHQIDDVASPSATSSKPSQAQTTDRAICYQSPQNRVLAPPPRIPWGMIVVDLLIITVIGSHFVSRAILHNPSWASPSDSTKYSGAIQILDAFPWIDLLIVGGVVVSMYKAYRSWQENA